VYLATVLAAFSRSLELEADLWACRAISADGRLTTHSVEQFVATLERLGQTNGQNSRRAAWLHPSIAQRIGFLRSVADDPRVGRRLESRLRLASAAAGALLAVAGIALLTAGGRAF
jgi:hypothetical protein